MKTDTIGNKATFAIEYSFFDDGNTEISVFINDKNILAYNKNGQIFTTRWKLDDLMMWLREFIDNMQEDPYPVECDGEYAALKDINAREFDSDDDDVLDEYFEKIYDWNLRHRWHYASNGAILADIYFQLIGNMVEISWNNQETDEDVEFECELGVAYVSKEVFISVLTSFFEIYAKQWF